MTYPTKNVLQTWYTKTLATEAKLPKYTGTVYTGTVYLAEHITAL